MERVGDVSHPRRLRTGVDGENVEAHASEGREPTRRQHLLRCAYHPSAFPGIDRGLGRSEAWAAAQPNLDEAERVAVQGHEIDLGVPQVDVARQNAKPLVFEEGLRDVFSAATQGSRVRARASDIRLLRDVGTSRGEERVTVSENPGRVYVVATPIGNLEDASARALRTLGEVALIACEDTRRTARLCQRFGIRTRRLSLHAHNEARRIPMLLARLEAGDSIALVSDAGTPLLSDPGAGLVRAALAAGLEVVPVPGPSALLTGLVASGFATRPFAFEGFLPRKGSARTSTLDRVSRFPGTVVLYEAPGRVNNTLADLRRVLGPRRVVVARELTKLHEEFVRGRLGEIRLEETRGEVTLIVEGPSESEPDSEVLDIGERIDHLLASGQSARDAARTLASELGLPRSKAYRHVLERKRELDSADP